MPSNTFFSFYKKLIIFAIVSAVPLHLMSTHLEIWQIALFAVSMFFFDLITTLYSIVKYGFSETSPGYVLVFRKYLKSTKAIGAAYVVTYCAIITISFTIGIGPQTLTVMAGLHAFVAITNVKKILDVKKYSQVVENKK